MRSGVTTSTLDIRAALEWKGQYGDLFSGGFTIAMDSAGAMTIDYAFTYHGPEIATREIGLSFELPLAADCFEWDRAAEWSYYPDDHIARPRGYGRSISSVAGASRLRFI